MTPASSPYLPGHDSRLRSLRPDPLRWTGVETSFSPGFAALTIAAACLSGLTSVRTLGRGAAGIGPATWAPLGGANYGDSAFNVTREGFTAMFLLSALSRNSGQGKGQSCTRQSPPVHAGRFFLGAGSTGASI